MATVAVIIGGAIVNALAFTLGNALYDKFGRGDGSEERYRHDKAVEDLQKANQEWSQKRLDTLDFINSKIREKNEARGAFDDVDRALDFYNKTHPDGLIAIPRKPVLSDFYRPSNEHNYNEIFVVAIIGSISGYVSYKLFNRKNKLFKY